MNTKDFYIKIHLTFLLVQECMTFSKQQDPLLPVLLIYSSQSVYTKHRFTALVRLDNSTYFQHLIQNCQYCVFLSHILNLKLI